MKNTENYEIDVTELEIVSGGTANKNPMPGSGGFNKAIDEILNAEAYDFFASLIAGWIQPAGPRTRKVDNNVDIYDCDV